MVLQLALEHPCNSQVIFELPLKMPDSDLYLTTENSLKKGQSGISKNSTYAEMGFRSHVSGAINLDLAELIDRKTLRFMSEASGFGYIAAKEAIHHASLNLEEMNVSRIGIDWPFWILWI